MLNEKHDLIHELPEYRDTIHELKTSNNHFARLFDQYHEVDHEVHRIETGVETTSDEYLEEKKKQRLHLKDELFQMIKKN
ncbi:MAG: YdcH family protein [Gammaproteobacteria bacterium]|nr:YdcH family protein [Gammaproteobacteria bacterium]MCW8986050.1 YdcH family protein [Gammaproteobacteria bacterium]MCW9031516.1 YdcH family protein [Gammaproteobacteria bacterium]